MKNLFIGLNLIGGLLGIQNVQAQTPADTSKIDPVKTQQIVTTPLDSTKSDTAQQKQTLSEILENYTPPRSGGLGFSGEKVTPRKDNPEVNLVKAPIGDAALKANVKYGKVEKLRYEYPIDKKRTLVVSGEEIQQDLVVLDMAVVKNEDLKLFKPSYAEMLQNNTVKLHDPAFITEVRRGSDKNPAITNSAANIRELFQKGTKEITNALLNGGKSSPSEALKNVIDTFRYR